MNEYHVLYFNSLGECENNIVVHVENNEQALTRAYKRDQIDGLWIQNFFYPKDASGYECFKVTARKES